MRVGELAERAGVSVRALHYYEEKGLLEPLRTSGGHREYDEPDVARVRFVRLLLSAGLPSRAIVEILPFLDTGIATEPMRRHLDRERTRIEEEVERLTQALDRLRGLQDVARRSVAGLPPAECILAAEATTSLP